MGMRGHVLAHHKTGPQWNASGIPLSDFSPEARTQGESPNIKRISSPALCMRSCLALRWRQQSFKEGLLTLVPSYATCPHSNCFALLHLSLHFDLNCTRTGIKRQTTGKPADSPSAKPRGPSKGPPPPPPPPVAGSMTKERTSQVQAPAGPDFSAVLSAISDKVVDRDPVR